MMTVAESRQMIKKLKHIRPLSGVAIVLVLTTSCASRRLSAVGGQAALGCAVDPNVIGHTTVVNQEVRICTPPTPPVSGVMICESTANEGKVEPLSIDPSSLAQNGTATQMISAP